MHSTTAPDEERLLRHIARKFAIRRWFGELYVGKRMKQHRLARRLRELTPPPGAAVLEVGSEDGCFSEWIDRKWPQARILGLERDQAHALATSAWAERMRRAPKLKFIHQDVMDLEARDTFDVVLCLDVLGYILDDHAALEIIHRAVKPGGRLLVHQPNVEYRRFGGRRTIVAQEVADKITAGHVRHGYRPEQLSSLLSSVGFEVECVEQWHGPLSDLAHRLYKFIEHPAFLRFAALPVIDVLSFLDRVFPREHGNTVYAVARRAAE